jgi:hypothetical protein
VTRVVRGLYSPFFLIVGLVVKKEVQDLICLLTSC